MKRFVGTSVLGILFAVAGQAQITVVNAASSRTDQPVTAGSWVSGYGTFANVSATPATSLPLPKSLGGVTVTVEGVQATLNFAGPTQVNFVIPYSIEPGLRPVVVTGPAGTVNGTVRVISAAPGIFPLDTATPPQGAILNQDSSVNGESRPAIRGQFIQIFATGHSALSQAVADDGSAAPANPLITTAVNPQVFIGGVEATEIQFSGLTPGSVSLWQINVKVPELPFLHGRLPLQIFMNGVDSNEVTIYVE